MKSTWVGSFDGLPTHSHMSNHSRCDANYLSKVCSAQVTVLCGLPTFMSNHSFPSFFCIFWKSMKTVLTQPLFVATFVCDTAGWHFQLVGTNENTSKMSAVPKWLILTYG